MRDCGMASTYDALLERLRPAFDALKEGSDPVLRPSDRGDFQANGALALAKELGQRPADLAQELARSIDLTGVGTLEVSGPGFLTITLEDPFIDAELERAAADARLGVPLADHQHTVVIDYSHPNVAKEMHVGHLRSTIIGDSVRRIYEHLGHRVIARNHIGDWGTPFGMLIEHLIDVGEAQASRALSIGDLQGFYQAARTSFDASEDFRERSRHRVVLLQSGDPATRRLWEILVAQSTAYFAEVYRLLDVRLRPDEIFGESSYHDLLAGVVDELGRLGLLVEDSGAQCVFPPGFTNREGEPLPLIVRKSDEGYGYAATDLAAIRQRVRDLHADEILYIVGAPQSQHLEMVFATARMAGWLPDSVNCRHVAFGSVLGTDHKMLRSRGGTSSRLIDLVTEAIDRAEESLRARGVEFDGDERHRLSVQIARSALKYADLATERVKDYVFDLERMLAFEGDTGPYLEYAHARIRSIFRRLEEPADSTVPISVGAPAERDLALTILGYPEAVRSAHENLAPHKLCTYLNGLAHRFTAFYETCPVLQSAEPVRSSRLALCALTARTLEAGLSLLGIEAVERM
jgi:arginyl-tRNA synthetase